MILITGAYLVVVCRWLESQNLHSTGIYERIHRIKASQRVPIEEAAELVAAAAHLRPDAAIGLDIASHIRWQHLGALARIIAGADTVEDLLHCYITYERLFYGESLASMMRTPAGVVEISWHARLMHPLLAQLTIGSFVVLVRRMFAPANVIVSAGFQFDDRANAPKYEHFFGHPTEFNCRRTYIRFENLQTRVASTLVENTGTFREVSKDASAGTRYRGAGGTAKDIIQKLKIDPSFQSRLSQVDTLLLERVVKEVVLLLPKQEATLDNVADRLHMSVRTLQRQLSSYSSAFPDGFRGLLGAIRFSLAQDYLRDPGLDLRGIALLLGYSEQSAFHLAFKRWTGISPGQWQRKRGW